MTLTPLRAAAALAVCGALLPLAAQADSAVSSASSAGSASSGSVSDSLRGSSRSMPGRSGAVATSITR